MKVDFDEHGTLTITPETNTETLALLYWYERWCKSEASFIVNGSVVKDKEK